MLLTSVVIHKHSGRAGVANVYKVKVVNPDALLYIEKVKCSREQCVIAYMTHDKDT